MNRQNEIRANLIGGNIQCTKGIGEAWDQLHDQARFELVVRWRRILDVSEAIVADIVESIASHPKLGSAWHAQTEEFRQTRIGIFRCIAMNDMTHPDGTTFIQRTTNEIGEQAEAQNPGHR